MNTYPLIRNRWSNEHLLTALFIAVSLYQLPDWTYSAFSMLRYSLFVIAAMVLDATINYIRFKKPICAVSAAVTAAVLYPIVKDLPGWAGMLGILAALVVGKHMWGGTGKNILNPAVTGMFILSIFFPIKLPIFEPSYLLIPALILSLPFIIVRFFPGIGFIAGMLSVLLLNNSLDYASIMTYGVIFWGCIVITDPVTATDKPIVGLLSGLVAGFLPFYINPTIFALSLGLLIFNGVSSILDMFSRGNRRAGLYGLTIKAPIKVDGRSMDMIDLTGKQPYKGCNPEYLNQKEILEHIGKSDAFGMGGAGFPTKEKFEAVIRSGANEKYLIINGMECDPGLIHDKWLMKNRQSDIGKGIAVIEKMIKFKSIYFIKKESEDFYLPKPVEMYLMPDKYPYGAEKIFVKKLLGIGIPENSNPAQYGVLVLNVQTVLSVYEAACRNEKTDTRYITVADLLSGTGNVVRVNIGERVSDIVEKTVVSKGMTFVGGGIMQVHPAMDEEVVGKTTNFIAVAMLPKYKESLQCINCGLCRRYCPMGLNVKKIADLVDKGKLLEAQACDSHSCISCGSCSYVCLAGRNLSGRIPRKAALIE